MGLFELGIRLLSDGRGIKKNCEEFGVTAGEP